VSPPPITKSKKVLHKWVIETLRRLEIKPRKRLSQVFLVDPKPLFLIAYALRKQNADEVIEIGAGLGTLTTYIAEIARPQKILAIEVDRQFVPILSAIQREYNSIDIVIGDALNILPSIRRYSTVVGNLPYHITSDLLIAIGRSNIVTAIITVQYEVGERLIASPGSENYGKLTVFIRSLFNVEKLGVIPRTAFSPIPEVDSVILILRRIRPYNETMIDLERVTKCVFSYRRKLLYKALLNCLGDSAKECFSRLGDVDWNRIRVFETEPELFLRIVRTCVKNQ